MRLRCSLPTCVCVVANNYVRVEGRIFCCRSHAMEYLNQAKKFAAAADPMAERTRRVDMSGFSSQEDYGDVDEKQLNLFQHLAPPDKDISYF